MLWVKCYQKKKKKILPVPLLRPLCHGLTAQPAVAKATNLYRYSNGIVDMGDVNDGDTK